MVSKTDLDIALKAWEAARHRAAAEHLTWGRLLRGHKALISLMRSGGKTFREAEREFGALSQSHCLALISACETMDRACRTYQEIAAQLDQQQGQ